MKAVQNAVGPFGKSCVSVVLLAVLAGTACSGHYLRNRLRDAGDVFTGEVQTGAYGASMRMGPIKAGAYYKGARGKAYGLRGGYLGNRHTAEFTALLFGADYHMGRPMQDLSPPKDKNKDSGKGEKGKAGVEKNTPDITKTAGADQDPLIAELIKRVQAGGAAGGIASKKNKQVTGPDLLTARGKEYRAYSPFGTRAPASKYRSIFKAGKRGAESRFVTAYYFTQLEFSLGFFGGIKLGFNPGELLDFFLGFLTIDIYGDDAPYPNPLLKRLRANPAWQQMDEKTRQRVLRELSR